MTDSKTAKARIAERFSRAAERYDDLAQVQLDIAFDLIRGLPTQLGRCLDLGCGTGRVTRQLTGRCEWILGGDLAFNMLQHAQTQLADPHWINLDAESLPFQNDCLDTVVSSMALQWCNPIDSALAEIHRVLKAGGKGYLAILSDGSLFEMRNSWLSVDGQGRINPFQTPEALILAAKQAGFVVHSHLKSFVTWHDSVKSAMNSIRGIGAGHVSGGNDAAPLRPSVWLQMQQQYSQVYGVNGQVPLTYQVLFMEIIK